MKNIVLCSAIVLMFLVTTAAQSRSATNPKPGSVLKNSIGMELIYIPRGNFVMGSEKYASESPAREVTIEKGFWMGRYEVTQGQWQTVMGTTLRDQRNKEKFGAAYRYGYGEGSNYPMYYVSWSEAKEFINKLNAKNDGFLYRLPTETEWEYAARGGSTEEEYIGDIDELAWYMGNSEGYPHPVGTKRANGFGLYDVFGNVEEWVTDIYNEKGYAGLATDGSANVTVGNANYRVLRGGNCQSDAPYLRVTSRNRMWSSHRHSNYGFRIVATLVNTNKTTLNQNRTGNSQATNTVDSNYFVRVYNVDDFATVYVNDFQVLQVRYTDAKQIDITNLLHPGSNDVRFVLRNFQEGYTYGFEIRRNNELIVRDECGVVNRTGCRGSSQTGVVYDRTVTIKVDENADPPDLETAKAIQNALNRKGLNKVKVVATVKVIILQGSVPRGRLADAVQIAMEIAERTVINELVETK
jgi:formylglycine-generating enzyme required for sulfatase activity/phosphoribosylformylglycinamidine (FGAM) synthase PurS component